MIRKKNQIEGNPILTYIMMKIVKITEERSRIDKNKIDEKLLFLNESIGIRSGNSFVSTGDLLGKVRFYVRCGYKAI